MTVQIVVSTLNEWKEQIGNVGIPKTENQTLLQTYEQWISENPKGYECDDEGCYPVCHLHQ